MPVTKEKYRPLVMGIVNVTPNSFSDGGRYNDTSSAITHALTLVSAGADMLDIGGESTRPGAEAISASEELNRVLAVIEALAQETPTPISIDTMKPEVAHAAMAAGAVMWNDVSALQASPNSLKTAASLNVPVVLMHMQGEPGTMQKKPRYDDVVAEVITFLRGRADAALVAGVQQDNIILDPGIGFGKRLRDNLALIRELPRIISETGFPVLFGASRKRFIEMLDPGSKPDDRLGGSLASALWAAQSGVHIVRVHDVAQTVQALKIWQAIGEQA